MPCFIVVVFCLRGGGGGWRGGGGLANCWVIRGCLFQHPLRLVPVPCLFPSFHRYFMMRLHASWACTLLQKRSLFLTVFVMVSSLVLMPTWFSSKPNHLICAPAWITRKLLMRTLLRRCRLVALLAHSSFLAEFQTLS